MKRSASQRSRRKSHHFLKIRNQDTSENSTRMASTNFVSRLEVSTRSHGVVGTARPTWSSTCQSSTTEPSVSCRPAATVTRGDRKSTRLNSSHDQISYAVFCLKKKKIA